MEESNWKQIETFPEYEIHPTDGVRRAKTKKMLKARNWLGYPKVTLLKDRKKHERRVHRLVATHFIDNPLNHPIVNHKDSDRSNFSVSNLEWTDNSGNQLHRWKTQKDGVVKKEYAPEYGKSKKKLHKAAFVFINSKTRCLSEKEKLIKKNGKIKTQNKRIKL